MTHLFCAFLIGGALSTLFISTRSSAGNWWLRKNPSSRCRSAVHLCRWLQQQCFLHSSPVISCPISKLKPSDSACCCFPVLLLLSDERGRGIQDPLNSSLTFPSPRTIDCYFAFGSGGKIRPFPKSLYPSPPSSSALKQQQVDQKTKNHQRLCCYQKDSEGNPTTEKSS